MKILTLSNGTELKVCDLSSLTEIVNVFASVEEAESFRENLTDELMTGAKLWDEFVVPPFDDMSYTVNDRGRVTARYFAHVEPAEEITYEDEFVDETSDSETVDETV